ncbi:NAD(P)-binding protein [Polychaeton citri CBS 116435]|uniref:NAD(P)-binding protein n=1 Tax=Polychaeton citri CBS 116435 TaxID=1314669 RepID=A0A9P4QAA2_9PEZI|nr:NAD(P)-binding protein [Polychaeton citri CBS 116435]
MSSIQKVALAGATGALGKPVLQALLDAGFTVTALTRASSSSSSSFPSSVHVAKVDYDDVASLTTALKGQDAVVSTIAGAAISQQIKLIDAAIAAGVKRVIPSEFGSDTSNPKTATLPVFKDKVAASEYLVEKSKESEGKLSYTFVLNNAFLDWGVEHKFIIDIYGKKITLYDGGETPFSTTTLASVGKATAASLTHAEETKDRIVKIHNAVITQRQLLAIAQRVVGSDGWTIEESSTDDAVNKANEDAKNGNVGLPQIVGWLSRAIYAPGYGGEFKDVDNELLGITEIGEEGVEKVIRGLA